MQENLSENEFRIHIRNIVKQATKEKMLPKILISMKKEFNNKTVQQYKKNVYDCYLEKLKKPLEYNPEETETETEKLEKIIFLTLSKQLKVDYFNIAKEENHNVIKFMGSNLEEKLINTKNEHAIFKNLNPKTFVSMKKTFFNENLEVDFEHVYPIKNEKKDCCIHIDRETLKANIKKKMYTEQEERSIERLKKCTNLNIFKRKEKSLQKIKTNSNNESEVILLENSIKLLTKLNKQENKLFLEIPIFLPFTINTETGNYNFDCLKIKKESRSIVSFFIDRIRHQTYKRIYENENEIENKENLKDIKQEFFLKLIKKEQHFEQIFVMELHSNLLHITNLPFIYVIEEHKDTNLNKRYKFVEKKFKWGFFEFISHESNFEKIISTIKIHMELVKKNKIYNEEITNK